jgi:hypothetical protein
MQFNTKDHASTTHAIARLNKAEVPVELEVPVTLSLVGPVSSNFGKYEQKNSYFCLGLISCSKATNYVMSLTPYGINIVLWFW